MLTYKTPFNVKQIAMKLDEHMQDPGGIKSFVLNDPGNFPQAAFKEK